MKASVLALTAAGSFCSGCFVVHERVDPGEPLDASFELTWDLEDIVTGKQLDCVDVGADTVRVIARNADTGDKLVDLFDCDSYRGVTASIDAGDYVVKVDLLECGSDTGCLSPDVIAAATLGPVGVWDDAVFDLGHIIFRV